MRVKARRRVRAEPLNITASTREFTPFDPGRAAIVRKITHVCGIFRYALEFGSAQRQVSGDSEQSVLGRPTAWTSSAVRWPIGSVCSAWIAHARRRSVPQNRLSNTGARVLHSSRLLVDCSSSTQRLSTSRLSMRFFAAKIGSIHVPRARQRRSGTPANHRARPRGALRAPGRTFPAGDVLSPTDR